MCGLRPLRERRQLDIWLLQQGLLERCNQVLEVTRDGERTWLFRNAVRYGWQGYWRLEWKSSYRPQRLDTFPKRSEYVWDLGYRVRQVLPNPDISF